MVSSPGARARPQSCPVSIPLTVPPTEGSTILSGGSPRALELDPVWQPMLDVLCMVSTELAKRGPDAASQQKESASAFCVTETQLAAPTPDVEQDGHRACSESLHSKLLSNVQVWKSEVPEISSHESGVCGDTV